MPFDDLTFESFLGLGFRVECLGFEALEVKGLKFDHLHAFADPCTDTQIRHSLLWQP